MKLIDADSLLEWLDNLERVNRRRVSVGLKPKGLKVDDVRYMVNKIPTFELTMGIGNIGDCVLWNTGVGERIFEIQAIEICRDGIRYDLGYICPFVNHKNIVRIMSREEAERMLNDGK